MNFTGTKVVTNLVPLQCCDCSCWFGIDEDMNNRRHQDKGTFYCPAGHPQLYKESDVDRLNRHLKFAEQDAERARRDAARERQEKINAKSALTKTKNRIARGICPCCNRTFSNLQQHIVGQHPEYDSTVKKVETASIDQKIHDRANEAEKLTPPKRNRKGRFLKKT